MLLPEFIMFLSLPMNFKYKLKVNHSGKSFTHHQNIRVSIPSLGKFLLPARSSGSETSGAGDGAAEEDAVAAEAVRRRPRVEQPLRPRPRRLEEEERRWMTN